MTIGSCFSGIGGELVAASMLGWDVKFFCEKNPFGRTVLEYWYPNAKSYEDITTADFREWRGRINVLTGGFPCQPFSFAGQRRGAEDDRYLWPAMHNAIDEIQPTWVVAENVAGILTMVEQGEVSKVAGSATLFDAFDDLRGRFELRETFTLQRICTDLESHGYAVQPVLVPACAVGAPHRRDRVFIVARRKDITYTEGKQGQRSESRQSIYGQSEQVESGRRGGEDGSQRNTTDTDREGLEERMLKGRSAMEAQGRAGMDNRTERPRSERPSPHPDSHRGSEVDEHVEPELADGAKPVSNGGQRNVADTARYAGNTNGAGAELSEESRVSAQCETEPWRICAGIRQGDRPVGERWANFPSVSPVHRGNDGLPFDVDRLTLSFGKWRTEALKAYGNAIVPQVMYEIFRAIEQVETL